VQAGRDTHRLRHDQHHGACLVMLSSRRSDSRLSDSLDQVANFSTSTPVTIVAFQIVLLAAMKVLSPQSLSLSVSLACSLFFSDACYSRCLFVILQNYFDYGLRTLCGFPSITLEGTVDDWTSLRKRAEAALKHVGWDAWSKELLLVLDEFVAAASGKPNLKFWQSFYKQNGGSGQLTVLRAAILFLLVPLECRRALHDWQHQRLLPIPGIRRR